MQGAIADDCMDAGGRAMQGAIAEQLHRNPAQFGVTYKFRIPKAP